jgi:hypothetical protein
MLKNQIHRFLALGFNILLIFTLATPRVLARETLWEQDFEDLAPFWTNWHQEGGIWKAGALEDKPFSAFQGDNVAGVGLTQDISGKLEGRLVRHESFTVPGTEENPRLELWYRSDLGGDATFAVQVSEFGVDWITAAEISNLSNDSWSRLTANLTPFSGQTIQLALSVVASQSTGEGIFADRIRILSGSLAFPNPELFDDPEGDWSIENGNWEIGTIHSDENSVTVAGTRLTSNFLPNQESRLISPPFTVPSETQNPRIKLRHWFDFPQNSEGVVEFQRPGAPWTALPMGAGRFTGESSIWSTWRQSLSFVAGEEIRLGFRLQAGSNAGPGWFIDELEIVSGSHQTLSLRESFVAEPTEWHVSNGVWERDGTRFVTLKDKTYPPGVKSGLVSPWFSIPTTLKRPSLRIRHWFDLKPKDHVDIQVQQRGGFWETASTVRDQSLAWSNKQLSLDRYANKEIRVRFNLASSLTGSPRTGYHLDKFYLVDASASLSLPESFDSKLQNWAATAGVWEIGSPGNAAPQPHSGNQIAGTFLGGNYPAQTSSILISPPIRLPLAAEEPRLSFWSWHQFGGSSKGELIARRIGESWSDPLLNVSGESRAWTKSTVLLQDFAGEEIEFGYRIQSDNSTGLGWYLDDMNIETGRSTIPNPETFEQGLSHWAVDGGNWEVGQPSGSPQPFQGDSVAGTILAGNYGINANSQLISPSFRVPATQFAPRIRFWHWRNLGAGDSVTLQIITTDTVLPQSSNIFTGSSQDDWLNGFQSLAAFAGQEIRLAFHLQSNASDQGRGFYVDNIHLETNIIAANTVPDIVIDEGQPVLQDVGTLSAPYRLEVTSIGATWLSPFEDSLPLPPHPDSASATLGLFNWQTGEAHGPADYRFRLEAVDPESNWNPVDFDEFTVTINELNRAPSLSPIPEQTIIQGQPFSYQIVASDTDLPQNQLIYALTQHPDGAEIDSVTGLISWKPSATQAEARHDFEVIVTDNGDPARSSTIAFVASPSSLLLPVPKLTMVNGQLQMTVDAVQANQEYQILASDQLTAPVEQWEIIKTLTPDDSVITANLPSPGRGNRFYIIKKTTP